MRKSAVTAAFLILLAGTAAAFSASIETIDRTASTDNPGQFELTVENTLGERELFSTSVNPHSQWFNVEKSNTFLDPGETKTLEIQVTPPDDILQQNYMFNVFINAGDQTQKLESQFAVKSPYDISITRLSSNKASYEPGEEAEYTIELANTARETVEDYSIRAELGGHQVNKSGLPLDPSSQVMMTLSLEIPENTPPGDQDVTFYIERGETQGEVTGHRVEVERLEKIERTVDVDNRILFYFKTIGAENQGNTENPVELQETLPRYLSPITSFDQEPDQTEIHEDSYVYTWNLELEPGSSDSVSYTIQYWIPLTILAALLGGLVLLKRLRNPVKLVKTGRETEDGVKIHIEVENRSNETLKNVELTDFVPDIASVNDKFAMARPVIRKTPNGTRLTWDIEELEPGDQRVFEYTINPLFEVEGDVTLPEAELKSEEREPKESSEVEVGFNPRDT